MVIMSGYGTMRNKFKCMVNKNEFSKLQLLADVNS